MAGCWYNEYIFWQMSWTTKEIFEVLRDWDSLNYVSSSCWRVHLLQRNSRFILKFCTRILISLREMFQSRVFAIMNEWNWLTSAPRLTSCSSGRLQTWETPSPAQTVLYVGAAADEPVQAKKRDFSPNLTHRRLVTDDLVFRHLFPRQ